jgi:hypothetical protein
VAAWEFGSADGRSRGYRTDDATSLTSSDRDQHLTVEVTVVGYVELVQVPETKCGPMLFASICSHVPWGLLRLRLFKVGPPVWMCVPETSRISMRRQKQAGQMLAHMDADKTNRRRKSREVVS